MVALAAMAGFVALALAVAVTAAAPVSFAPAINYGTGSGSGPQSVAVSDLNGDAMPDLVVANHNTDDVAVLLNGSFGSAASYGAGAIPTSVAIGDLNSAQDHMADLVVTNANSNDVSVLLGDGNGGFAGPLDYGVHGYPTSVAVGNLNPLDDGYADLVVTNLSFGDVSVLLGDGDGGFAPAGTYGADPNAQPSSVAVDKLNGDGWPDLVVANRSDVSVLLGNGHGTFTAGPDYPFAGSQLRSVAASDLNGDSITDLVVADNSACCGGSDRALVLRGNGDGTFQPAVDYAAGSPAAVAIGDVNGDMVPDLAVADIDSNQVSVLLGTADGAFEPAVFYAADAAPYSVAIRDLNGDGKPDLAVANVNSDDVSVLLNTTVETPGSVTQTASGGSSVTTDPGNVGATAGVPVQTQVALPSGLPSTTVSITAEDTPNWHPPNPSFPKQVVIDVGGRVASASNPFVVTFTLDTSLIGTVLPADVQISRDDSGLSDCTDPVAAIPDACIASRAPGLGGDAIVTVRTTHFSKWSFGRLDYAFGGFLRPVDNLPTVNTMKAGSAVPVKFSLGGNKGLNIFQSGYPRQGGYSCDASPTDPIEQTVTAGGSSLSYDATTNTYTYVWKTDKTWAGSCRELTLRLRDGSTQKARFQLSK